MKDLFPIGVRVRILVGNFKDFVGVITEFRAKDDTYLIESENPDEFIPPVRWVRGEFDVVV